MKKAILGGLTLTAIIAALCMTAGIFTTNLAKAGATEYLKEVSMKKLLGIFILIVAAITGVVLYYAIDTERFIEELPQPPAREQSMKASPTTNSTPPAAAPARLDENKARVKTREMTEESENAALQEDSDASRIPDEENGDWRTDNRFREQSRQADPWSHTGPEPAAASQLHFSNMSPNQQANFLRDSWIEMFGDIPEVHTAAEYMRKVLLKERMTVDEVIEGLEASHHLFPGSGFNMRLKHYRSMKEMGIPLFHPEDLEKPSGVNER